MRTDVTAALMEGPPARPPERVDAETALRGRRVTVYDAATDTWARDLRAVEDPYWLDEPTGQRWPAGPAALAYAVPMTLIDRATLQVAVAAEPDWYQWKRDDRRPLVKEYPAHYVWAE